jgi:hypothetical protein
MKKVIVALALFATACGAQSAATTEAAANTTTTVAAESTSAPGTTAPPQTTTTLAEATTTAAPTPVEALVAATEGWAPAGVTTDTLLAAGEAVCDEAAGLDPASMSGPLELSTAFVAARELEPTQFVPTALSRRFVSTAVESLCPEYADGLAYSSEQWANTIESVDVAPGTCLGTATSIDMLAVDCAEPHGAEVIGTVAIDALGYPYQHIVDGEPVDGDQHAQEEVHSKCSELAESYVGTTRTSMLMRVTPVAEWDAGNREALCAVSFGTDVDAGEVAGAGDVFELADAITVDVATCATDAFSATVTNTSDLAVGVVVSFVFYYVGQSGRSYAISTDRLEPAETASFDETFVSDTAEPSDQCLNPIISTFPVR